MILPICVQVAHCRFTHDLYKRRFRREIYLQQPPWCGSFVSLRSTPLGCRPTAGPADALSLLGSFFAVIKKIVCKFCSLLNSLLLLDSSFTSIQQLEPLTSPTWDCRLPHFSHYSNSLPEPTYTIYTSW